MGQVVGELAMSAQGPTNRPPVDKGDQSEGWNGWSMVRSLAVPHLPRSRLQRSPGKVP